MKCFDRFSVKLGQSVWGAYHNFDAKTLKDKCKLTELKVTALNLLNNGDVQISVGYEKFIVCEDGRLQCTTNQCHVPIYLTEEEGKEAYRKKLTQNLVDKQRYILDIQREIREIQDFLNS